jgi:hypothetical protein
MMISISNVLADLTSSLYRPALKFVVGIYAVFLVLASIYMFIVTTISTQVNDLVANQNAASLKLWAALDYYQHNAANNDNTISAPQLFREAVEVTTKREVAPQTRIDNNSPERERTSLPLPPGLFESVVEFSRLNATLLKTVPRLTLSGFLWPQSLPVTLQKLSKHNVVEKPPVTFSHYGVDPDIDEHPIVDEGQYQIRLFQAIRDYAQDKVTFERGILAAASTYLLPVAYSLLGAFLYALRVSARQGRRVLREHSIDRTSRFVMAGIAGIAVAGLDTLLPKEVLLPPLAIAFVVGYSVDILTSRLDGYVRKFKKPVEV